jgi:tetratricopeptide (TPR) repeat protein
VAAGPDEIAAAVEAAVADHRAGRLDAAEQGYRGVLQADPHNLRAAYNLGLILVRRKDFHAALPMLAHAFETAPPAFPAWSGYAEGLIAAGRFPEAERVLAPHRTEPRGAPLELRLRQAWGLALSGEGRHAEALDQLRRAADLAPDDPETHSDLGLALVRAGQSEPALASLQRALVLDPGRLAAAINAGVALKDLGRPDDAEAAWREVLARHPGNAAAARNLHGLLIEQGRFREALEQAEAGLARAGKTAELLRERGIALHNLGRYEEALDCFEPLLVIPDFRYEALTLVGLVLSMLGRRDEALATLDQAIAESPENPAAYYRRAFIRLQRLEFEGGWRDYEKRLDMDDFMAWAGVLTPEIRAHLAHDPTLETVQAKRVLLVAEQGIGAR